MTADERATRAERTARRWPLALIAAPAAVSIWSGWVGLGGMAGFGPVHPLPGIAPGFVLNTAITLPIGVEAYGAYALGAWLAPGAPPAARKFARSSALGALLLGMAGQVAYHLLAAAHATAAPWPVTVLVSCVPVAVLGLAAALTHLLRAPVPASESAPVDAPPVGLETAPQGAPEGEPAPVLESAPQSGLGPVPGGAHERVSASTPEAVTDRSSNRRGSRARVHD